jgi:hypothetical protein
MVLRGRAEQDTGRQERGTWPQPEVPSGGTDAAGVCECAVADVSQADQVRCAPATKQLDAWDEAELG